MSWMKCREAFEDFLMYVNSFHLTFKFKYCISSDKIAFLDVEVSVCNGSFDTRLYRKDTDTHQLIVGLAT